MRTPTRSVGAVGAEGEEVNTRSEEPAMGERQAEEVQVEDEGIFATSTPADISTCTNENSTGNHDE